MSHSIKRSMALAGLLVVLMPIQAGAWSLLSFNIGSIASSAGSKIGDIASKIWEPVKSHPYAVLGTAAGVFDCYGIWKKFSPTSDVKKDSVKNEQNYQINSIIDDSSSDERDESSEAEDASSKDFYYENVYSNDASFSGWKGACDNGLPKLPQSSSSTILLSNDLRKEIKVFLDSMSSMLKPNELWLGDKPSENFFNNECLSVFEPYVQKLVVDANAEIAIHGDFHGDVHSLNEFIDKYKTDGYLDDFFKIIKDDFYILFLGDYTDRGQWGAEVIYTVLRLKNANPDKVFMIRGNHEDIAVNYNYGFARELCKKFPNGERLLKEITRIYNYLPLALYLGCKDDKGHIHYIQCCHGGIEIGYTPNYLLNAKGSAIKMQCIKKLDQKSNFCALKNYKNFALMFSFEINPGPKQTEQDIINMKIDELMSIKDDNPITVDNGFMWSDFSVSPIELIRPSDRGKYIFEYGKQPTEQYLTICSDSNYTIESIFRAHQHTDNMCSRILNKDKLSHQDDAGVGKLWINDLPLHKQEPGRLDGIKVATFSVAPYAGYSAYGYTYDAYGLLKMASTFDDWRLEVIRSYK